jgi:hypothetical protein
VVPWSMAPTNLVMTFPFGRILPSRRSPRQPVSPNR